MKTKKTIIAIICLFAASFLSGSVGSQVNPLISRGWLEGDYRRQLMSELDVMIGGKAATEEARLLSRLTGGTPLAPPQDGVYAYVYSSGNTAVRLTAGQSAILPQGTTFYVTGDATLTLERGDVLDLTSGTVAARTSGSETTCAVVSGHRYMLPEASHGYILATAATTVYADGWYAFDNGEHPAFGDVMRIDWFYSAVDYVYANGIFRGTGDNAFSPQGEMTRAMFVTVLYRLAGQPEPPDYAPAMSDTSDTSQYYYDAVRWGVLNSVVLGYDDGTFRPDGRVTREQMAVLLYRYAALAGYETAAPSGDGVQNAETYPDWTDVSDYAQDAFTWACGNGIINGSDGKLLPKNRATRAQVAQMILNFVSVQPVAQDTPDDTSESPAPDALYEPPGESNVPVSPDVSATPDLSVSPEVTPPF